jgi:hypothetical protein
MSHPIAISRPHGTLAVAVASVAIGAAGMAGALAATGQFDAGATASSNPAPSASSSGASVRPAPHVIPQSPSAAWRLKHTPR